MWININLLRKILSWEGFLLIGINWVKNILLWSSTYPSQSTFDYFDLTYESNMFVQIANNKISQNIVIEIIRINKKLGI